MSNNILNARKKKMKANIKNELIKKKNGFFFFNFFKL